MASEAGISKESPSLRGCGTRVVFLINGLGRGGGERLLMAEISELRRRGIAVELYVLTRLGALAAETEAMGVLPVRLTWEGVPIPTGWWQFYRALRRADLLRTCFFYSDLVGTLFGRCAGVPRIISSRHDDGYWMRGWHRPLERWLSRHLDAVLCVSDAVRAAMLERGSIPDPLRVVRPGIEWVSEPEPAGERARVILCVGRMVPVKNHALLLRAFADLRRRGVGRDWRLQIVGDGPERERLGALGAALELGEAVEWVGEVAPPVLGRLYRSASVFALPSISEAAPLSLMEAMAAGLATVAFDVGGVGEFLRHQTEGLLVPAGEAQAFGSALELLLQERVRREAFGKAATARAAEQFGLARYVEQVVAYEDQAFRGARP